MDASEGQLWPWLAAADLVINCISNACAEAIHLNRVSPLAYSRRLFLLGDPELRTYHSQHCGLPQPPMAAQGLALMVGDAASLPTMLNATLDSDALESFWRGTLFSLIKRSNAARRIAHMLCDTAYGATH